MNVQSIALNSANVRYNNANDESRNYNIEANVVINKGVATNGDNGIVTLNDETLAVFSYWDENHLNITFYGINVDEQCTIGQEVNAFIESVKSAVNTSTISI